MKLHKQDFSRPLGFLAALVGWRYLPTPRCEAEIDIKPEQLRRIDRWGVAIAFTLFVAMWSFRFLPLQRCEVHGEWLQRRPTEPFTIGFMLNWPEPVQTFPHAGYEYFGDTSPFGVPMFDRTCPKCREARRRWFGDLTKKWK